MKEEKTIEENAAKNYLLDYRSGGDLGPLKIITISFALSEEDEKRMREWLSRKLFLNERAFTIGEPEIKESDVETDESSVDKSHVDPPGEAPKDGNWQTGHIEVGF